MSDDGYCHDCEDVRYCGTMGKCLLGKRAVVGVSVREEVSDERLVRLHSEAMARANAGVTAASTPKENDRA